MELYLYLLSTGGYYRNVGLIHGISKSTVMSQTRSVANFFMSNAQESISLPLMLQLDDLATPLLHPDLGRKLVILYIDGFIVRIQRPDYAGDAYFCGRTGKSCDSLNVQYIVDRFGKIRHIITGISGACHDKTAISWSQPFMEFLDNLPNNYVVLGDPAYRGLHPNVLTRYTGNNLTPEQHQYNNVCVQQRQIVERAIGAGQIKWRIQQLKENRLPAKQGIIFPSKCVISAAVLHNRFTNYI